MKRLCVDFSRRGDGRRRRKSDSGHSDSSSPRVGASSRRRSAQPQRPTSAPKRIGGRATRRPHCRFTSRRSFTFRRRPSESGWPELVRKHGLGVSAAPRDFVARSRGDTRPFRIFATAVNGANSRRSPRGRCCTGPQPRDEVGLSFAANRGPREGAVPTNDGNPLDPRPLGEGLTAASSIRRSRPGRSNRIDPVLGFFLGLVAADEAH